MMQDMNSAMLLMSWEAQPCSSWVQRGRILVLVRSWFIVISFAFSTECDLRDTSRSVCYSRNCLSRGFLLRILRVSSLCASFEMTFECILRDALRVSILRGALICAYVEVPCYVHTSRCHIVFILRGALMWDVWGEFQEKCLPPFSRMAHQGSLSKSLESFGWFFWHIHPEGLLGNVGLGDTRGFLFLEKNVPLVCVLSSRRIFSKVAFCKGKLP